jgi:hypothetical protein
MAGRQHYTTGVDEERFVLEEAECYACPNCVRGQRDLGTQVQSVQTLANAH